MVNKLININKSLNNDGQQVNQYQQKFKQGWSTS
jgi:hypothetical protein